MEADIIKQLQECQLNEAERPKVKFSLSDVKQGYKENYCSCFGWMFADREINMRGLKESMKKVWKVDSVRILKNNNGVLQFFLPSGEEAEKAVENGPWIFDSNFLAMRPWLPGIEWIKEDFMQPEVWIHVLGLPRELYTKEVGVKICATFNTCSRMQIREKWETGEKFLRIKASIDLMQPIRRGIQLEGPNNKSLFGLFRYEKIPSFCYCCGKMGHNLKECPEYDKEIKKLGYGFWLNSSFTRSSILMEVDKDDLKEIF